MIAALREDATQHQTVVWVDWDGQHVVLDLTTKRTKLGYLQHDPRVSVLVRAYEPNGIEGYNV